jgi:hypothetical protein
VSFGFSDVPLKALSEASFGGIWGGDQSPKTLESAEGDIEIELGDVSIGTILYALLGTYSKTGPTDTTAYTHNFSLLNSNQHPSLSLHIIDPIGQLLFEMSMIDKLVLKIELNRIVSVSVSFKSKGSATSSGQTASYVAEKKFVGRNLTFKVAATTASLAAAAKVSLKSLTLTIEKNADVQSVLSSVQPNDIVNKRFNITGDIELNYEDRTWLDYLKNGDYKAVRIALTHDDTITGAASTKYSLTLDLSKVSFDVWSPNFAMDDVVTQKLTFNALYDAGLNNNVINACTLINGQSGSY